MLKTLTNESVTHGESSNSSMSEALVTYTSLREQILDSRSTRESLEIASEMLPDEAENIRVIFHASSPEHHKYKNARNQLPTSIPISHAEPTAPEREYSRAAGGRDPVIAGVKATRFRTVTTAEDSMRAIETLREMEQNLGNVNEKGLYAFSLASDVMFRRILPDGSSEPVFQLSNLNPEDPQLKDKVVDHLRRHYGSGRPEKAKLATIRATETTAVQELFGLGGYWQREKTFVLKQLPDSFLYAYLHGLRHPQVDEATRQYFMAVYEDYKDSEDRDRLLMGWNPETGIDAKRLIRVNDALKIDNPLLWGVIDNIDGVRGDQSSKSDKESFARNLNELVKIVTADPIHIHKILRTLMYVLTHPDTFGEISQLMQNDLLNGVAKQINQTYEDQYPEGLMGQRWINVSEALTQLHIPEDYLKTDPNFSLEKRRGIMRS